MKSRAQTVAYIDAANLHKGVTALGWELDYSRFRVWLAHRFGVGRAYIFIGMMSKHKELYTYLNSCGFILVYKEVVFDKEGKAKGNCDADLIVKAMEDVCLGEVDNVVLVTSDGDYAPLINFLQRNNHSSVLVAPSSPKKCSILLKRTGARILYLDDKRGLVALEKKKPPAGTYPGKGLSRGEYKDNTV